MEVSKSAKYTRRSWHFFPINPPTIFQSRKIDDIAMHTVREHKNKQFRGAETAETPPLKSSRRFLVATIEVEIFRKLQVSPFCN